MKKLSILAIALVVFQSCIKVKSGEGAVISFTDVKGTGPVTDKTYSGDFNSIEVSSGLDAEVIKSGTEKVIISAPSDLQDLILVENNGGDLHIHYKSGFRINLSTKNVKVKIFAKDFSSIKANSSADVIVKDKFTQDKMSISTTSSGSLEGDFEANSMDIKSNSSGSYKGTIWALNATLGASSSGDIFVKGKVKDFSASASSSATINAKDVQAEKARVEASSSGDVLVSVTKEANASASSSGDVVIYRNGNPSISKNESSSGSVTIR